MVSLVQPHSELRMTAGTDVVEHTEPGLFPGKSKRSARRFGFPTTGPTPAVPVDAVAQAPVTRTDLTRLYREHYSSLVRLAGMLIDEVSECEEVVQDAFVRMFELRNPPPQAKAPAYLRSAVLNGARSRLRKRVVRRKHSSNERPGVVAAAEIAGVASVHGDAVLQAVRGLPKRQSEVLLLRYYLDLTEVEIADTLGISTGSVKTHASRGIARLGQLLEDEA